jgi:streptomycin 6-kinase
VQTANEPGVLKILSKIGAKDERGAADALRWFGGHGAVELLRHDNGAMLLELAEGGSLASVVESGRDDEATKIIADLLNKLHFANSSEPPKNLIPLLRRFRSLLEDGSARQVDPIIARGAAVARELLHNEVRQHVLHGDIHHDNIRWHSRRGWLAIDPKGVLGERVYDAANALCNPHSLPELVHSRDRLLRQAEIMASGLGVDQARLLAYTFAHACLSACWSVEDGQDPSHSLVMARIAESCSNIASSPARTSRPDKGPS